MRRIYLGDGLYGECDQWGVITLRAPRASGEHYVVLEPKVMIAFEEWVRELRAERSATPTKRLPKIFVFCNGCSPGWHTFVALTEDGEGLCGHLCSDHGYAFHDMGVRDDGWKRDIYAKRYPDGFEVEYVEVTCKADAEAHPGLAAAMAKNRERTALREAFKGE